MLLILGCNVIKMEEEIKVIYESSETDRQTDRQSLSSFGFFINKETITIVIFTNSSESLSKSFIKLPNALTGVTNQTRVTPTKL